MTEPTATAALAHARAAGFIATDRFGTDTDTTYVMASPNGNVIHITTHGRNLTAVLGYGTGWTSPWADRLLEADDMAGLARLLDS